MNPPRSLLHSLVDALPEEALDRAFTMLAALEAETPLSPEIIAGIERGLADLKAGRGIDAATVSARMLAIIQAQRDTTRCKGAA